MIEQDMTEQDTTEQAKFLKWTSNVNGVGLKKLAYLCRENPTLAQHLIKGPDGKTASIRDLVMAYGDPQNGSINDKPVVDPQQQKGY